MILTEVDGDLAGAGGEDSIDAEAGGSEEEDGSESETESECNESQSSLGADRSYEEASTSSVVCVTGDYAMQNVILQMGLRLAAPDGMQIRETRRWALRCSACFQVSQVQSPH